MRIKTVVKKLALAVFSVCSLIGLFAGLASAQSAAPVEVGVIPLEVQAAVGQTFDVAVEVVNVADLYAIDVLVAFDPQAVEVIDQDAELDGVQVKLGTLLEPGFVIFNLADNELGRLRMIMTQLKPATPKSGTGTLIVITFKAKAPSANAPVEVLSAKLASPAGQEIAVARLGKASLNILTAVPGPTNTPIPAQDPGTPMPTPEPPTAAPLPSDAPASIATFTPASSFLNLPVTPFATQPPPPTAVLPTSTPAHAPSAAPTSTGLPASASSQAIEHTDEPQTDLSQPAAVESSPAAVALEAANQAPERGGNNFAWLWLLLAAVLVGGGVYFFLRSRKRGKGG